MAARRVPAGVRIFTGLAIFVLAFLLIRPSDPATPGQINFWKKAAELLGEHDVEGFVGITLLIVCSIATIVGYPVVVRLIEKVLNLAKDKRGLA